MTTDKLRYKNIIKGIAMNLNSINNMHEIIKNVYRKILSPQLKFLNFSANKGSSAISKYDTIAVMLKRKAGVSIISIKK